MAFAFVDYEVGSDNVFDDLGLDNAEELKTKTLLLIEIRRIIKKKKLRCFWQSKNESERDEKMRVGAMKK